MIIDVGSALRAMAIFFWNNCVKAFSLRLEKDGCR